MAKDLPLDTLLELSQMRMDDAAKRLAQLIASETEGEQKLSMLVRYRMEYQSRFLALACDGIGPQQWANYSAFLARLDEAVEQQRALLTMSQQRTVEGQQHWLSARQRNKAFGALSERQRSAQLKAEGRQEQKTSDEHAAKSHRLRDDDDVA